MHEAHIAGCLPQWGTSREGRGGARCRSVVRKPGWGLILAVSRAASAGPRRSRRTTDPRRRAVGELGRRGRGIRPVVLGGVRERAGGDSSRPRPDVRVLPTGHVGHDRPGSSALAALGVACVVIAIGGFATTGLAPLTAGSKLIASRSRHWRTACCSCSARSVSGVRAALLRCTKRKRGDAHACACNGRCRRID